jgi:hypothetical protein
VLPFPYSSTADWLFFGGVIGGTSHALGTASLAIAEPKIAPPSAVTFLVTGKKFQLAKPEVKHARALNTIPELKHALS